KKLEGTSFAFSERNDHVEAICPWGNRVRCYEPDATRFGRITLGIPYVEFDVPAGTAKAICAFYPAIMGMHAEFLNGDGAVARVNRNPAETNRTYAPGHEQWAWAMGPDEYDRR